MQTSTKSTKPEDSRYAMFKFLKSDTFLKWMIQSVIIFGVIVIGIVILLDIAYAQIPVHWKMAISTFILLLPFSLFLQAWLNVTSVKEERIARIQDELRKKYAKYTKKNSAKVIGSNEIDKLNANEYEQYFVDRATFLQEERNVELYVFYQKAYWELDSSRSSRDEEEYLYIRKKLLFFEIGSLLNSIFDSRLREEGLNYRSYLAPLTFFTFMYLIGFLITLPLIESIFTGEPIKWVVPLNPGSLNSGIPILVIQWGFLGGLVYTSINLLYRFLRKDLSPKVYFNASFKLILSAVTSIVIYFLYSSTGYANVYVVPPPWLLLLVFIAGIAPIQILINLADKGLSRIYRGWTRGTTAGNKPIIQLEGINSLTADRLSEEGIDYMQQMAMCRPDVISLKTNFPLNMIKDWKEQAILQILTSDIGFSKDFLDVNNSFHYDSNNNQIEKEKQTNLKNSTSQSADIQSDQQHKEHLNHILSEKLGIRTISAFIETWRNIKNKDKAEQKLFFNGLGFLNEKSNPDNLFYLFENISKQGELMVTEYNSFYEEFQGANDNNSADTD